MTPPGLPHNGDRPPPAQGWTDAGITPLLAVPPLVWLLAYPLVAVAFFLPPSYPTLPLLIAATAAAVDTALFAAALALPRRSVSARARGAAASGGALIVGATLVAAGSVAFSARISGFPRLAATGNTVNAAAAALTLCCVIAAVMGAPLTAATVLRRRSGSRWAAAPHVIALVAALLAASAAAVLVPTQSSLRLSYAVVNRLDPTDQLRDVDAANADGNLNYTIGYNQGSECILWSCGSYLRQHYRGPRAAEVYRSVRARLLAAGTGCGLDANDDLSCVVESGGERRTAALAVYAPHGLVTLVVDGRPPAPNRASYIRQEPGTCGSVAYPGTRLSCGSAVPAASTRWVVRRGDAIPYAVRAEWAGGAVAVVARCEGAAGATMTLTVATADSSSDSSRAAVATIRCTGRSTLVDAGDFPAGSIYVTIGADAEGISDGSAAFARTMEGGLTALRSGAPSPAATQPRS